MMIGFLNLSLELLTATLGRTPRKSEDCCLEDFFDHVCPAASGQQSRLAFEHCGPGSVRHALEIVPLQSRPATLITASCKALFMVDMIIRL